MCSRIHQLGVEPREDRIGLDLLGVLRPREGIGCGLSWLARTADGFEEVLEPARHEHPHHLQLAIAVVDQLVLVPRRQIDGGARHDRMLDPVDDRLARALEKEQQLLVGVVPVVADMTARRDHLNAHRERIDRRIAPRDPHFGVTVGGRRLPEAFPLAGLNHDCGTLFRLVHRSLPIDRFPGSFGICNPHGGCKVAHRAANLSK